MDLESIRRGVEAARARIQFAMEEIKADQKILQEYYDACPHPLEERIVYVELGIEECRLCMTYIAPTSGEDDE